MKIFKVLMIPVYVFITPIVYICYLFWGLILGGYSIKEINHEMIAGWKPWWNGDVVD